MTPVEIGFVLLLCLCSGGMGHQYGRSYGWRDGFDDAKRIYSD